MLFKRGDFSACSCPEIVVGAIIDGSRDKLNTPISHSKLSTACVHTFESANASPIGSGSTEDGRTHCASDIGLPCVQWNAGSRQREVECVQSLKIAMTWQCFPQHIGIGQTIRNMAEPNRFDASPKHARRISRGVAVASVRTEVISLTAVV